MHLCVCDRDGVRTGMLDSTANCESPRGSVISVSPEARRSGRSPDALRRASACPCDTGDTLSADWARWPMKEWEGTWRGERSPHLSVCLSVCCARWYLPLCLAASWRQSGRMMAVRWESGRASGRRPAPTHHPTQHSFTPHTHTHTHTIPHSLTAEGETAPPSSEE